MIGQNDGGVPCIGPSSSSLAIVPLAKREGGIELKSMGAESLERDDAGGKVPPEGKLPAP